ncbi:aspartate-semialdehyde dehydrogenase [Streptomyces sp. NPDC004959]|uniref:aspartate-semialdehyde dehydrogenase n=1 Tax=unclassified Streptomyces TaxID=2593676 RepID=UPI0004C75228|nr:aspartate-semialdehyde dehydrogenase [Streptomyces sp. NRRL F-5630]
MTGRPVLAVVGATGIAGGAVLGILSQHADIWGEIRLFASARSAGRVLSVRGTPNRVRALEPGVFDGVDLALFLVPEDVAEKWAPRAVEAGAVVVDTSAAFRTDPDVPLVVPEVNPHAVRARPRGIVAGPQCTTLAMIVALGALHGEFGLTGLVVSTYEAVSAAGRAGTEALWGQLGTLVAEERRASGAGTPGPGTVPGDVRRVLGRDTGPFPDPVALNVVPWTGAYAADGWTTTERMLRDEPRRVLGLPALPVSATCVRVPVVTTHSLTVHARFEHTVSAGRAREILATAPGVVLIDDPGNGEYPTPVDAAGTDPAWVGRVRADADDPHALDFFVCADNVRKGRALNAVQIAELVVGAR